jgi:hypothetical protein
MNWYRSPIGKRLEIAKKNGMIRLEFFREQELK